LSNSNEGLRDWTIIRHKLQPQQEHSQTSNLRQGTAEPALITTLHSAHRSGKNSCKNPCVRIVDCNLIHCRNLITLYIPPSHPRNFCQNFRRQLFDLSNCRQWPDTTSVAEVKIGLRACMEDHYLRQVGYVFMGVS